MTSAILLTSEPVFNPGVVEVRRPENPSAIRQARIPVGEVGRVEPPGAATLLTSDERTAGLGAIACYLESISKSRLSFVTSERAHEQGGIPPCISPNEQGARPLNIPSFASAVES